MILGVIPARGGSNCVPRKNVRLLCGKPLIAWSIEAADASSLLDRYVVSTKDSKIAEIAINYGAQVMDRPQELATDEADTLPVLLHVLEQIEATIVVLLQLTSPIRDTRFN